MTTTQKKTASNKAANQNVSEDKLRELIRQELELQRQNRLFHRRIKPFFQSLYDSKFAWFLFGILIGSTLLSFPFHEKNLTFWKDRISIIKPIAVDTPQKLALDAPSNGEGDQIKRKTLSQACELIAKQIESGAITNQENVLSALCNETANILSAPTWKDINVRFDRMVREKGSLEDIAALLKEIAGAF